MIPNVCPQKIEYLGSSFRGIGGMLQSQCPCIQPGVTGGLGGEALQKKWAPIDKLVKLCQQDGYETFNDDNTGRPNILRIDAHVDGCAIGATTFAGCKHQCALNEPSAGYGHSTASVYQSLGNVELDELVWKRHTLSLKSLYHFGYVGDMFDDLSKQDKSAGYMPLRKLAAALNMELEPNVESHPQYHYSSLVPFGITPVDFYAQHSTYLIDHDLVGAVPYGDRLEKVSLLGIRLPNIKGINNSLKKESELDVWKTYWSSNPEDYRKKYGDRTMPLNFKFFPALSYTPPNLNKKQFKNLQLRIKEFDNRDRRYTYIDGRLYDKSGHVDQSELLDRKTKSSTLYQYTEGTFHGTGQPNTITDNRHVSLPIGVSHEFMTLIHRTNNFSNASRQNALPASRSHFNSRCVAACESMSAHRHNYDQVLNEVAKGGFKSSIVYPYINQSTYAPHYEKLYKIKFVGGKISYKTHNSKKTSWFAYLYVFIIPPDNSIGFVSSLHD